MPTKLPNINLNSLTEKDLERLLKFGKGSNKLGNHTSKPFTELPYGVVRKDLPTLQKKGLHLDYILLILECQFDEVDISDVTANEMMAFLLWIREQQNKIYNIEKAYLSSEPDAEQIAAGINKLDEFGALSTIHSLAQGDILRHPQIEALPYFKVYEVLKLEKTNRDIKRAHEEIIRAQAKNKTKK